LITVALRASTNDSAEDTTRLERSLLR
jgi:hypothetical protein